MQAQPPPGSILVLNAGSSSLKFAVFGPHRPLAATARGTIEDLATAPHLLARDAAGATIAEQRWAEAPPFDTILHALLAVTDTHLGTAGLAAIGHRIVHGGMDHAAPERVTKALLASLQSLIPLDPLHMPDNLAPIHAMARARPDIPQIACFDTAFHRTMPKIARNYALPRAVSESGVCRYGFHGLSYEYIAATLPDIAPALASGRVIVAHLGSGASLCAMRAGKSIATTMGFGVLDGLVMATRCGTLDPGIILYLARQGQSLEDIEDMLYHQSGLRGVSGISSDIRVLLASDHPHAREAIDLFTTRIAEQIGALTSNLGGLDGVVFTGGIGEHAPAIRQEICNRLSWLGVALDNAANESGAGAIGAADSKIDIRVIGTDEEMMIARHVWAVMSQ